MLSDQKLTAGPSVAGCKGWGSCAACVVIGRLADITESPVVTDAGQFCPSFQVFALTSRSEGSSNEVFDGTWCTLVRKSGTVSWTSLVEISVSSVACRSVCR